MGGVSWILLVEDEADHRALAREALTRVAAEVPVHEAIDGKEAMTWLRKRSASPEAIRGGVVILDLGLPNASGFQVLEWMREMPTLARVPAVVLTASENPMDAEHAFNLGARGYFQKPTDFRRYLEVFARTFHIAEGSQQGAVPV
jgi:CheY-like chemotaxis protein